MGETGERLGCNKEHAHDSKWTHKERDAEQGACTQQQMHTRNATTIDTQWACTWVTWAPTKHLLQPHSLFEQAPGPSPLPFSPKCQRAGDVAQRPHALRQGRVGLLLLHAGGGKLPVIGPRLFQQRGGEFRFKEHGALGARIHRLMYHEHDECWVCSSSNKHHTWGHIVCVKASCMCTSHLFGQVALSAFLHDARHGVIRPQDGIEQHAQRLDRVLRTRCALSRATQHQPWVRLELPPPCTRVPSCPPAQTTPARLPAWPGGPAACGRAGGQAPAPRLHGGEASHLPAAPVVKGMCMVCNTQGHNCTHASTASTIIYVPLPMRCPHLRSAPAALGSWRPVAVPAPPGQWRRRAGLGGCPRAPGGGCPTHCEPVAGCMCALLCKACDEMSRLVYTHTMT